MSGLFPGVTQMWGWKEWILAFTDCICRPLIWPHVLRHDGCQEPVQDPGAPISPSILAVSL